MYSTATAVPSRHHFLPVEQNLSDYANETSVVLVRHNTLNISQ